MRRGLEAQHQAEQYYRPTRGWRAERPQTKKYLCDFLTEVEKSMHELKSLFNDSLSSNNSVLPQHFHGIFKESVICTRCNTVQTHPCIQPNAPLVLSRTAVPVHTFDVQPQGRPCFSPRWFQVKRSSKDSKLGVNPVCSHYSCH